MKQNDLNRMTKEIHNKFISEEIVAVIMISKNLKSDQSIKRDILIQNIEDDDLMFIFYWQSCYMSLRYSLIFLHDEQNWNNKISLNDFQINRNLFVRRKRIASNDLYRYNQSFVNSELFFKMCRHWKTSRTKMFLQTMIVVIKENLHEQFKLSFINFYYKCVFEWIPQIRCFFQTVFVFYLSLNWHRCFFKIETMKKNSID